MFLLRSASFRKIYAAPFPVFAAIMSFLFLAISIGSVTYFLRVSAARENEIAFRDSLHIVKTAFSLTEKELRNWAKDYAWWDDTVEKASTDILWAEDNIGTYMQNSFGVSGSFVVTPDLETVFYSPRNAEAKKNAVAFIGKKGSDFLKQVQSTDMSTSTPMVTYVYSGNELFLVAAAPITKEHPTGQDLIPTPRPVLILYKVLSGSVIDEMATQFLLNELTITKDAPTGKEGCFPLNDSSGDTIAYISWKPAKPGDLLFQELMPRISLVSIMLFLVALIVFFAWWRTASQANEKKSRFLAKMSHELRTPLNPIIGFANLMSHETLGTLSPVYRGYAEDIHRCGLHLSAIIEDILDVSRIEAGELSLNESEIDVENLIKNLPAFSNQMPTLEVREFTKHPVRHEFAPGLPRLRADKLRVQQVLLNLLSNASKFSDNKEVVIRAFTKDGCICISVEDQGVGISKADLTMLFQPFVQVGNKDIEHRSHGTGLGLHVSRELVRLHGGDLYLESEPYRGTIAFVQFPSGRTI